MAETLRPDNPVPPFDLDAYMSGEYRKVPPTSELRRLASELRNAPHLMTRDDLDVVAGLVDRIARETPRG